jgi:hypothetical protein
LGKEPEMHNRPGGNRGHQFRDPLVRSQIEQGARVRSSGGAGMLAVIGMFKLLMFLFIGIYKFFKFLWSRVGKRTQSSDDVIDSSSDGIQYKVFDPDSDD